MQHAGCDTMGFAFFTNCNAKDFTIIFANLFTYSISVKFYKTAQLVDCNLIKQNIINIITNLVEIMLLKGKKMDFKIHIISKVEIAEDKLFSHKSVYNALSISWRTNQ